MTGMGGSDSIASEGSRRRRTKVLIVAAALAIAAVVATLGYVLLRAGCPSGTTKYVVTPSQVACVGSGPGGSTLSVTNVTVGYDVGAYGTPIYYFQIFWGVESAIPCPDGGQDLLHADASVSNGTTVTWYATGLACGAGASGWPAGSSIDTRVYIARARLFAPDTIAVKVFWTLAGQTASPVLTMIPLR